MDMALAGIFSRAESTLAATTPWVMASMMLRTMRGTASCASVAITRNR